MVTKNQGLGNEPNMQKVQDSASPNKNEWFYSTPMTSEGDCIMSTPKSGSAQMVEECSESKKGADGTLLEEDCAVSTRSRGGMLTLEDHLVTKRKVSYSFMQTDEERTMLKKSQGRVQSKPKGRNEEKDEDQIAEVEEKTKEAPEIKRTGAASSQNKVNRFHRSSLERERISADPICNTPISAMRKSFSDSAICFNKTTRTQHLHSSTPLDKAAQQLPSVTISVPAAPGSRRASKSPRSMNRRDSACLLPPQSLSQSAQDFRRQSTKLGSPPRTDEGKLPAPRVPNLLPNLYEEDRFHDDPLYATWHAPRVPNWLPNLDEDRFHEDPLYGLEELKRVLRRDYC